MDLKSWAPGDLPPFPSIAAKMLSLLSSEDVAVDRVIALVHTDPALSAGILRAANSALFALRAEVRTVKHAVAVLGFERVRNLTLTLALAAHLRAALRVKLFRRCWTHSLACAIAGEEFGAMFSVAPDLAYTAGLLHDMGRLGLLMVYPSDYAELLADQPGDVLDAEARWFGMDHCEAGRQLLEEWRLPEEIRDVAARHHTNGDGTSAAGLLAAVKLGCRAADALGYEAVRSASPPVFEELLAALPEGLPSRIAAGAESLRIRIGCLIESVG